MKNQLCVLLAVFCFHFSVYSINECDCSWDIDMVCVQLDNGNIIPFPNACWAHCMGYNSDDFTDCNYDISYDPACACGFNVEPVCVTASNGELVFYPNSCLAECQGYNESDFLPCSYNLPVNPNCACDYTINEVCVEIEENVFMPFPNACWALCLGYNEDAFVNCDNIIDQLKIKAYQIPGYEIAGDTSAILEGVPYLQQQIDNSEENVIKSLFVYPNPVDGNNISVKINTEVPAKMRIDLISSTGKLFKSINHTGTKGREVLMIDISDISAGIYYIHVFTGIHTKSMKFVKK